MKKSSDSMDPQMNHPRSHHDKACDITEPVYENITRSASVLVTVRAQGHLVILYIFIGVICGAAVGTAIFLIRRSRWTKKSSDSVDPQMDHPRPHHNTHKACDVTETVYENATMNHPRPHHDRRKVCDVTEPVYENVTEYLDKTGLKRATPSEEQNHRGSQHNKTLESPGDTYMTLEAKSKCSEYDTLDMSAGKASESRDGENASVQDGGDTGTKKPEEEEIEYASITIHHLASETKTAASQEDLSVIYSSIR
ncbi:B-cell receptor CD22-like protein [Labeo rohita]|uniref:B-cell receptor CD22-like protein n=1 Tax=Labeo rohita TaxID=84645 RepID=A0A498N529_LABRO|nr:B-cell receptor CD22-like protein [Labeo rohita]